MTRNFGDVSFFAASSALRSKFDCRDELPFILVGSILRSKTEFVSIEMGVIVPDIG
jgi:hypothetical protein